MKLKKIYLAFYAVFIFVSTISKACPTCVGRVQENSNTTFFHEDESDTTQEINTSENENVGGAS